MSKVVIIYHSLSGNTEKMAQAVAEGAKEAGATVTLKKAADAVAEDVLGCDAVVMGTPNFSSYMAGMMKDFFDRNLFALKGKVDGKPYGIFGSYGGGGEAALDTLNAACERLGLKKVADTVGAQREPSSEALAACKALGTKIALS
jgi:flavorubredoxin